jgi:hypothetical protein
MFYFDASLAAERQQEFIFFPVDPMIINVVFNDVEMLMPVIMTVDPMVINVVFNGVGMNGSGGQQITLSLPLGLGL